MYSNSKKYTQYFQEYLFYKLYKLSNPLKLAAAGNQVNESRLAGQKTNEAKGG